MTFKRYYFTSCLLAFLLFLPVIGLASAQETPTWTDSELAKKESPGFQFLGEYVKDNEAIQVVPCQSRFYLSIHQGGLPGAGWDGGAVKHEWMDAESVKARLSEFEKLDRASKLDFAKPPKNAIVLFDGSGKNEWANGKIKEGLLQAGAKTKREFRDFTLHFECVIPFKPELPLSHPARGNSGVFALGAYEIQIADTFGLDAEPSAWSTVKLLKKPNTWCGSIYGIRKADVNMCLPPLSWQSFDIKFLAARFEETKKVSNARMTVTQNGVLIHDDVELTGGTGGGPKGPRPEVEKGPIYIQNHHNPTQYRNIWIVEDELSISESKGDPKETTSTVDDQLVPGGTFTRTAEGKHAVTYHVYVPTSFKPKSPLRPIIVAFSPGGKGKQLLEKLRPAAESAGWLLVGCDKLRNGMNDENLEVEMEDEVLTDLFKNLPHDPKRVYLAGFSGGAMRAYGITARRSEPFAGILAYGGWLGGPSYQDNPYREKMSVAMINGIGDRGAGGWMPIDTKTLLKRNCTVKHFSFVGGHQVAPSRLTETAIAWLEEQWKNKKKNKDIDSTVGVKIPLKILYVGKAGKRAEDFKKYLSKHFILVSSTEPKSLTLEMANVADVLLLDSVVRTLPEGYTKAMLMTGSSAAMTAERYGSKIDWLCQCLDHEAYSVDTSHPIFDGPLPVTPTLIEKRCPHSKLKIQAWKVEEPQETPGLVSSRMHFEFAKDSEIISGGVNMKGVQGVPLVREAHRLLWGFVASPNEMTNEGRNAFVNSLVWIHGFDGHAQSVFAGLHERSKIASVLDSPYVDFKNLIRWFPENLIQQTEGDKEKIRKHFEGRLSYVHVPTGSGQLQVDEDAEQLKTPNNDPASLAKWVELLDGEQADLGYRLLLRYTGQRLRKKSKQWKTWLDQNDGLLKFSDKRGYRFFASEDGSRKNSTSKAFPVREGAPEPALTDTSPVLFERGLDSLHLIGGVAHQYHGRKVTLVIRARVKQDWRFYSATEDNGTNIPTKIEVELTEGMKFVGEWVYPKSDNGELGEGATFQRVIHVGDKPLDHVEIKGSIRFQACTADKCLPPQTLNFILPLTVMAK